MCGFKSIYKPFTSYWLRRWLKIRTYTHPFVFAYQRITRGWADCDTWNLDNHIARVLAESIEYLRVNTHGYPAHLTEDKWKAILKEMVEGFTEIEDKDGFNDFDEIKLDRALKLFRKHFRDLWD